LVEQLAAPSERRPERDDQEQPQRGRPNEVRKEQRPNGGDARVEVILILLVVNAADDQQGQRPDDPRDRERAIGSDQWIGFHRLSSVIHAIQVPYA